MYGAEHNLIDNFGQLSFKSDILQEHPRAIAYKDRILHNYCDLCLIYGNKSRNGRSNYSDIKMEINTNTLGMGIDDLIGDMQSPAMEFEISCQRRKRYQCFCCPNIKAFFNAISYIISLLTFKKKKKGYKEFKVLDRNYRGLFSSPGVQIIVYSLSHK